MPAESTGLFVVVVGIHKDFSTLAQEFDVHTGGVSQPAAVRPFAADVPTHGDGAECEKADESESKFAHDRGSFLGSIGSRDCQHRIAALH
jgi:hypothetical protein